jgi:protein ImuA
MENKGAIAWIGTSLKLFPPALFSFNIEPSRVLFIDLKREKELLWTMEEALKSEALSAVVGEIPEVSFIASRRLQLAVEKSRVTGFLLRTNPKNLTTTACVTRWQITSLPGDPGEMPGVGFPRWKVKLEKVRNGQPGEWIVEWRPGGFRLIKPSQYVIASLSRKIG